MKIFFTMLLMALAAACDKSGDDCINEDLINEEAICTMEYSPVCGCDGKTYSNDCRAINAGVTEYEPGECSGEKKSS